MKKDKKNKKKNKDKFKKNTKLLPCPFCGKRIAIILTASELEDCDDTFEKLYGIENVAVVCTFNKGGCGATSGYRGSKKAAIKAWNKRSLKHK